MRQSSWQPSRSSKELQPQPKYRGALQPSLMQVKSATARGYSNVMLGFHILMLKNAAAIAISWLDS
jgi:hypothetical protein